MPKTSEHPDGLRTYFHFGLDLTYSGSSDAQGECPFCGKSKLYVSQEKGLYDCKSCSERGNVFTFIRKLHADSIEGTPHNELEMVAEERKVHVESLIEEGLVKSFIDGEWLLPTYALDKDFNPGAINNLYRWSMMPDKKGGYKRRLLSAPKPFFKAQMFGQQFWTPKKPRAFITEGRWDGIKLKEAFSAFGQNGNKLFRTEDVTKCLYASCNIVSVPGCETFMEHFIPQFRGKEVALLFDNDHPRLNKKTGKLQPPGSIEGMKRAAKMLKGVAKSICWLRWGEEGYDESLPDGHDVRDLLTAEG